MLSAFVSSSKSFHILMLITGIQSIIFRMIKSRRLIGIVNETKIIYPSKLLLLRSISIIISQIQKLYLKVRHTHPEAFLTHELFHVFRSFIVLFTMENPHKKKITL